MGRAAQALGYEYLAICDHTRNVRVVPGSTPTTSAGRARRSQPRTRCSRRSGSSAGASATSSRTARSTSPTTCSPSSSGCRSACTPASAGAAKALTDRVVEAMRHPAASLPLAPEGPDPESPAGERARSRPRLRGRARDRRCAGGERPTRPARPRGGTRARGARRRRQDRLLDRCALGARAREHGAVCRHRAARRRPRGAVSTRCR